MLLSQIFCKCFCEDYSNWDCFQAIQQYLDLRFNYIESSWYAAKHLFDTQLNNTKVEQMRQSLKKPSVA